MSIFVSLSTLALRQIVDGACAAVGIKESSEAVVGFLVERFTDHSQRLTKALQNANDNAWKALEIALAGDSLWERCKATIGRAEDKAFAQQVRAFLDATQLPELTGKAAFRQKCLEELRAARKGKALTAGTLDPRQLAQRTAHFARFSDPTRLLDAEWQAVIGFATQVKEAGFPDLAWLLSQRPRHGLPILIVAVRYFFRRAVEDDQKLFQGLSFAKLEALSEAQERGFASLSAALAQQGQRLEELLSGIQAVVVQTHSAVLDLQGQMKGQGEQIEQIGEAVVKLLEQHQLQRREVRPGDSLSIRNEGERQLVKQLVVRYRSLPEGQRQNVRSLLNAIGKLEVVAGDFDAAQKDFQAVATMVNDTKAKAEAHFNAYQTALERRDFDAALKEFIEAVKLDAKRYAPFPVGKYHPLRILGAGGFGTAFLCRHKYMNAEVVVKAPAPGSPGPGHGQGVHGGSSSAATRPSGHHSHFRVRLRRCKQQGSSAHHHGLFPGSDLGKLRQGTRPAAGRRHAGGGETSGGRTASGARGQDSAPGRETGQLAGAEGGHELEGEDHRLWPGDAAESG